MTQEQAQQWVNSNPQTRGRTIIAFQKCVDYPMWYILLDDGRTFGWDKLNGGGSWEPVTQVL